MVAFFSVGFRIKRRHMQPSNALPPVPVSRWWGEFPKGRGANGGVTRV